ncbi:MAG: hypothetical protein IKP28_03645 [Clostridia bacterium]|nr:hypothetical protein [Clostridia bacterium]
MRKIQNKKGITLIALVITVIVLLILAGVAISLSFGQDSLFEKSNSAVTKWNAKVNEEETGIIGLMEWTDILTDGIKQVNDANPGVLEGSGTEADPYTINSIEDLVAFAYDVNTNTELYSGKTVTLGLSLDFQNDKSYANPQSKYVIGDYGYTTSDSGTAIKTLLTDTTGAGFVPIGNERSNGFAGTFDGNNHSIVNLYENVNIYGGLFGTTSNSITIRNLGIKSCSITANQAPAGGILGNANTSSATTTISNCYNTGTVTSTNAPAGGILGWASSTANISNCYNTGNINSTNSNVGGILGGVSGQSTTITRCYNTGDLNGKSNVSGIISINNNANGETIINNCYNTGTLTATTGSTGGILADTSGITEITECYNTGTLTSANAPTGGIVGTASNQIIVEDCYNNGLAMSTIQAGGIIGYTTSTTTITSCHNSKSSIDGSTVGGIIGKFYANNAGRTLIIKNCYNEGDFTHANGYIGGIIGEASCPTSATNISIKIEDSYNNGDITVGMNGYLGGILGNCDVDRINTTITNCYNTGNMTASADGNAYIGGISSYIYTGTVINCYNSGNIISNQSGACGIILIGNGVTIANCYNAGNISADGNAAVGILGYNTFSRTNYASYCYNSGNITGNTDANIVAGISGRNTNITNSHNTGNITAVDTSYAGEIITQGTAGTGCTYLIKTTNANSNGATGINDATAMAETMSLSNFVNLMNTYVSENPSLNLREWKLTGEYPTFK